jgi:hypothetical protein
MFGLSNFKPLIFDAFEADGSSNSLELLAAFLGDARF